MGGPTGGPPPAEKVHGATVPLLVDSLGRKFGKSEGNVPVWLDADMTSHHKLWQHLFSVADVDAPRLLRALSPASDEEQDTAIGQLAAAPEKKAVQRLLADGLVGLFRGDKGLAAAHNTAALLFGGTGAWATTAAAASASASAPPSSSLFVLPQRALLPSLLAEDVLALASEGEVTCVKTSAEALHPSANALPALLVASGLSKSRSEAKRLIDGGGIYWNWERLSPKEGPWAVGGQGLRAVRLDTDFIQGRAAVLSLGKRRMAVVELI